MCVKVLLIAPVDQNVRPIAYKEHVENKELGASFQYNTGSILCEPLPKQHIQTFKWNLKWTFDFYYDNYVLTYVLFLQSQNVIRLYWSFGL